jgi:hypothetical protein
LENPLNLFAIAIQSRVLHFPAFFIYTKNVLMSGNSLKLPNQILAIQAIGTALDISCAGQNLIGRKRELTTTGVKPWMQE